jgi:RNA polymerase primary sigma factor
VIALERHRQLTFAPPLSAEQEIALNEARLTGDSKARDQLILGNLRLVWYLSKRYSWSGIDSEDLFSSGVVGLVASVDSYDHSRGRLAPHARLHIRKEMLLLIASLRSLLHLPASVNYHALLIARAEAALTTALGRDPTEEEVAESSGLTVQRLRNVRRALCAVVSLDDNGSDTDDSESLHDALADEEAVGGDRRATDNSRIEWLAQALEKLSARERLLLYRHFGLDGRGGLPLAQVAGEMRVSRERLRQIEQVALRKLRHILQADGVHIEESLGSEGWSNLLRAAGLRLAAA